MSPWAPGGRTTPSRIITSRPTAIGRAWGDWWKAVLSRVTAWDTNSRISHLSPLVNIKGDPSVKTSIQGQMQYSDAKGGDVSFFNDYSYKNDPYLHFIQRFRYYDRGVVHRFSPRATLLKLAAWVRHSLGRTVQGHIQVEGWLQPEESLEPCPAFANLGVDSCGRQVLCCNYLHLAEREGLPSHLGREYVAHLMQVPLREGLRRQYHLLAELMEARLAAETPAGLGRSFCY